MGSALLLLAAALATQAQVANTPARVAGATPAPSGLARPGPAQAFAASALARSFSEATELPLLDGGPFSVLRQDGRYVLRSRDAGGHIQNASIDAVIGSGRHARILLHRDAGGRWIELPLAWYAEGGRYAASPGFRVSADCLGCHAGQSGDHPGPIGCDRCHGAGAAKPGQAVCLQCHPPTSGLNSGHGSGRGGDDKFELNSAAYRLLQSRCYQSAAGQLTCTTCHPAHSFASSPAGYRSVCRSCHPAMHNGAALDCPRCHMPKRRAQDAGQMTVSDHLIQRPL